MKNKKNDIQNTPFAPLNAEKLQELHKKCEEYKKDWRLTILPEDIDTKKAYETLRQDYLDESLDPAQKWIKNITISPEKFHDASKIITDKLAKLLQNNMKEWESFYPLYPWRAALAFVSSFRDIWVEDHLHIGIKRDEKTLNTEEEYMKLILEDEKFFEWKIVISDPMLATGGSNLHVIEKVLEKWIKEEDIE